MLVRVTRAQLTIRTHFYPFECMHVLETLHSEQFHSRRSVVGLGCAADRIANLSRGYAWKAHPLRLRIYTLAYDAGPAPLGGRGPPYGPLVV